MSSSPGTPRTAAAATIELRAVPLLQLAASRTVVSCPQVLLGAGFALVFALVGRALGPLGALLGALVGGCVGSVVCNVAYREVVGYEPRPRVRAGAVWVGMWLRTSGRFRGGPWRPGARLVRVVSVQKGAGPRVRVEFSDGSAKDLAASASLPAVHLEIPAPLRPALVGRSARRSVRRADEGAGRGSCAYSSRRDRLPVALACPPCSGDPSGQLPLSGGRVSALCDGHRAWLDALGAVGSDTAR